MVEFAYLNCGEETVTADHTQKLGLLWEIAGTAPPANLLRGEHLTHNITMSPNTHPNYTEDEALRVIPE